MDSQHVCRDLYSSMDGVNTYADNRHVYTQPQQFTRTHLQSFNTLLSLAQFLRHSDLLAENCAIFIPLLYLRPHVVDDRIQQHSDKWYSGKNLE